MEKLKDNSYERTYKEAEKAGKTQQLSHEFYQWEEEGQILIGKLIDYEPVESKDFEGTYNLYLLDTDDGLCGVICGVLIDKLMEKKDLRGEVLRIEYQGKKQLDAGRTVNRFRVDVIKP